ncbi:hypothetical protein RHMOL_Rhmol06G0055300 [Rhododendron molle]|uniref:Uncharacterized protein n=1 Tax=Rhododendron molle TaxID=49168 RepID=A0ACC0NB58_RHOML|nr:hypothetical protein RHMOL_Rhmol06G0055300 [Rhododendron molle]
MASSTISAPRSAAFRAASDCDPRSRLSSFETVREFWIQEGAIPLDTGGNTILHFLAMYGNAFVIQKLVNDENGNKSSSSSIVKCEDLLGRNDKGNTPLHEAARFGRKSVVEILLRKKESMVRERNSLGETPIYVAAACGHEDVYDHLITKVNRHPEIMTRSTDNSNLLHAAVMGEHYGGKPGAGFLTSQSQGKLSSATGSPRDADVSLTSSVQKLRKGQKARRSGGFAGSIMLSLVVEVVAAGSGVVVVLLSILFYFVAGGYLMLQQVVVWCSSGGGGGFGEAVGLLGAARAGVDCGGATCGGVVGPFSWIAIGACSPGSWDSGGNNPSQSRWPRLVVGWVAVKASPCCLWISLRLNLCCLWVIPFSFWARVLVLWA